MAEGVTGLSHGCWHPQHTSAVMSAGRVCSGQAGADGVSLAHISAAGMSLVHTDCVSQGSGGHQASWVWVRSSP